MNSPSGKSNDSPARMARRAHIIQAARALVGAEASSEFDAVHSKLCAIDVVMVAGAPWLPDGLERDFGKDESGYRKIGGSANTPDRPYFYRSANNLMHYLKRMGFYTPRGGHPPPQPGMACFFDWDDRGRYNFKPDRWGIITCVVDNVVTEAVVAREHKTDAGRRLVVESIAIAQGTVPDKALIGYSDLP